MSNILERLRAAESPHQQLFDEAHAKCDNSGKFDALLTCYLVARAFPAVLYGMLQVPRDPKVPVDLGEFVENGHSCAREVILANFFAAVEWAQENYRGHHLLVTCNVDDAMIDSITRSAIGFAVGLLYEAEIDGALPEKFIGDILDLVVPDLKDAIRKEAGNG